MLGTLKYLPVQDTVPEEFNRKSYDLQLPLQKDYKKSKNKILIIIGHVSSSDLRNKSLLSDDNTYNTLDSILDYAYSESKKLCKVSKPSFAAINFNFFKTYDLHESRALQAEKIARKRVLKLIKKLSPSSIIIFGDDAAASILKMPVADVRVQRGLLHELKVGDSKIPTAISIPFDRAFTGARSDSDESDLDDDSVLHSNILGYTARCIIPAFTHKLFYDASGVKPKAIYVDTLKKFKKMMKALTAHKGGIGVDTETANLTVHKNTVLSFQFAIDTDKGWFLPYKHKDSPFSPDDLKIISKDLKRFFQRKITYTRGDKKQIYFVGQNLAFDLRIIRHDLSIPYIYYPCWDTIAGEFCLDENIKALSRLGNSPYSLNEIFARYNNLHYYKSEFKKEDRVTIADVNLSDAIIEYGVMDAVAVIAIHRLQRKKAQLQDFDGKSYLPYYVNLMLGTLSPTVKTLSVMMERGVLLDINYLIKLMERDSVFNKKIKDCKSQIYNTEATKKANKELQKRAGLPEKSLFGGSSGEWLFRINKKDHKQLLYFDVLGLEPISDAKDGSGKLDKAFKSQYKDVPEVALLSELEKLNKLKTSYIDSFYAKIASNPDGKHDQRLRASYGYKDVVTGRLNSFDPSLQQIPEHGDNAKVIKSMFITPFGFLSLEFDYSAHEVRCGGIIADDKAMLNTFIKIHNIIVDYRTNPTKENKEKKDVQGDSHKMNYSFFTGMPVSKWLTLNKSDEGKKEAKGLRQIAKGIVFGAFYGIGLYSLAKSIEKPKDETEKILKNFFKKFPTLNKWLAWTRDFSRKNYYTYSLIGRKRNLFGYMTKHKAVCAAMERRAQNSPVQGIASDFSCMAADLYSMALYECLDQLGDKKTMKKWMPYGPNVMVHDSIKSEAPFRYYYLALHLKEWAMTVGLSEYLDKVFGIKLKCPLGVDAEIGASGSDKEGWDFNPNELDGIIFRALKKHYTIHGKKASDKKLKKLVKRMKADWEEQQKVLKVHEKYPLAIYKVKEI